jgi:hypothetical protein
MVGGGAYDVFVSHALGYGDAAAELNGWLQAQGCTTFFDRRELRPGVRWATALEDAIGRSRAVAILVGPHGIGNTQQYERERALIRPNRRPHLAGDPCAVARLRFAATASLQLLPWVDLSKGNTLELPPPTNPGQL